MRGYDDAEHKRLRPIVLAEETTCWICGEPGRPDDPLVTDHVIAYSEGGQHTRANLHAAHHSCNSRRR